MLSYVQLRSQVLNLASNHLSLNDFENWLSQRIWNLHKGADELTQQLAYASALRLCEHDVGDLSEAQLKRELNDLALAYHPVQALQERSTSPVEERLEPRFVPAASPVQVYSIRL
jgi:hypothetical protein